MIRFIGRKLRSWENALKVQGFFLTRNYELTLAECDDLWADYTHEGKFERRDLATKEGQEEFTDFLKREYDLDLGDEDEDEDA